MSNQAIRISSEELAAVAAQGIERAMQARAAVGAELSQQQLDQVSGGISFAGIIAGGRRLEAMLGFSGLQTNPAAGSLAAGIQGATQLG